jgi:hypothetical protein
MSRGFTGIGISSGGTGSGWYKSRLKRLEQAVMDPRRICAAGNDSDGYTSVRTWISAVGP